jgi:sugar phosphate isomerase/epimerase
MAAATPLVLSAQQKRVPVGLELYSVRNRLKEDLFGTVRAVAKMGYEGVEFFSPYFEWTPAQAREMRALLNDLGMPCLSTHNSNRAFDPDNIAKAIELNRILGSEFIVMASAGKVEGLDGWKKVADKLNAAAEKFKAAGLGSGFHNHAVEFRPIDGVRPMDVLAKNTTKDVILQLDVGTCIQAGADPVAWIREHPGRTASIHLKDYSPQEGKGFRVLFGEGAAPWKQIFEAAESVGGAQHYLIEQETHELPEMEVAERCLALYRKLRA